MVPDAVERKRIANSDLRFPRDFVNEIICGDTVSVMRQIPDAAVDLVITSPPYNLGKEYERKLSLKDYVARRPVS